MFSGTKPFHRAEASVHLITDEWLVLVTARDVNIKSAAAKLASLVSSTLVHEHIRSLLYFKEQCRYVFGKTHCC